MTTDDFNKLIDDALTTPRDLRVAREKLGVAHRTRNQIASIFFTARSLLIIQNEVLPETTSFLKETSEKALTVTKQLDAHITHLQLKIKEMESARDLQTPDEIRCQINEIGRIGGGHRD